MSHVTCKNCISYLHIVWLIRAASGDAGVEGGRIYYKGSSCDSLWKNLEQLPVLVIDKLNPFI